MFKPFADIALALFNIIAISIAGVSAFNKRKDYSDALEDEKKKKQKWIKSHFRAFKSVYAVAYRAIVVAIVISILIIGFGVRWSEVFQQEEQIETPQPVKTPSPPPAVTTKYTKEDAWLDELDPIISKHKAFFLYNWSSFDPIQVENATYPHCIGICIPFDKLQNYILNGSNSEQSHSEFIEYRLSYQYETLQFKYGIDDISFSDDIETASMCQFKIIVQYCNSKEFLSSTDNILFDSDWINYRSILYQSPMIDVSGRESIRITVMWKFNVRQDGPVAFNIAIIDPILRVPKADTTKEQQQNQTTKPDSIR